MLKKSITDLQLKSESDFRKLQHVRSREPYFVQAGYTMDNVSPYRSMGSVDSLMLVALIKRCFTGAVLPVVSIQKSYSRTMFQR